MVAQRSIASATLTFPPSRLKAAACDCTICDSSSLRLVGKMLPKRFSTVPTSSSSYAPAGFCSHAQANSHQHKHVSRESQLNKHFKRRAKALTLLLEELLGAFCEG